MYCILPTLILVNISLCKTITVKNGYFQFVYFLMMKLIPTTIRADRQILAKLHSVVDDYEAKEGTRVGRQGGGKVGSRQEGGKQE